MPSLKAQLKTALENTLPEDAKSLEVVIQDTPSDKPGDYGSPIAFQLAKALKQNPAQIAKDLATRVQLPQGISRAEAVGPYLNFFVDASAFVQSVVSSRYEAQPVAKKVIIEHTSVNPNKEWHVGHIRGALIGDALGRIYREAGYSVEIQNYIDDTGRQAAESLFAAKHYKGENWLEVYAQETSALPEGDLGKKLDHWLGELYVRLHKEYPKDSPQKAQIEPGIAEVTHALERGELRPIIERIVRAHLETAKSLGVEYDLLTWESDVVGAGFVQKALDILETSPYLIRPTEGQYAGTLGIDVSEFAPGLEEPYKVLVRSNGTFVYVTKDIGFHYWKFGLFEGLKFKTFVDQQLEKPLFTTAPDGEADSSKRFAHGNVAINVIDARQSLQQIIVKASLNILEHGQEHAGNLHHLANETVLLEGQTMSGRKGITVSADEVIVEAQARAFEAMREISPNHPHPNVVAPSVGIGALKFAFLKVAPERQIDFRWDAALSLQGDTAVVVQYAHARARSIIRKYEASGYSGVPDFEALSNLELDLMKVVSKYAEILALCIREDSPHPMCAYALELAATLNAYANHKDSSGKSDTNVLFSPPGLREARLAVVARVADAIRAALAVLGIDAPDEM
jgi:arginyl-tRNA synthetase